MRKAGNEECIETEEKGKQWGVITRTDLYLIRKKDDIQKQLHLSLDS